MQWWKMSLYLIKKYFILQLSEMELVLVLHWLPAQGAGLSNRSQEKCGGPLDD